MPRQSNEIRRQVSTLLEPSLLERIRPLAERQSYTPSSYIRAAVLDRVSRDEPESEAGVTLRLHLPFWATHEAIKRAEADGKPLHEWIYDLVEREVAEL